MRRLSMIWFCILIAGSTANGLSCARLLARPEAWVGARSDALIRSARAAFDDDDLIPAYEQQLDIAAATLARCKLAENVGFAGRYRQFVEYIQAASLYRLPGHELGFNVPDKQYFAETRAFVEIPDFLLTPDFLSNASRYETVGRAKAFLTMLNQGRAANDQLIFFSYTSRHLGTPDNNDSYRRLLVVVPGDAGKGVPDRWVQFGLTDPGERVRVRNLSVVSALKGDDGTYNTYFKDYYRTYRRDGSIRVKGRWELGFGDDNCASCHKSGVLPIFPVKASVRLDEQTAVDAANERFRRYGSPRFGGYLDPTHLGPGLSTTTVEERKARFGPRFAETAIGAAMSCSNCHTPNRLGYLNWPMDQVIISSYIRGGQMPRGHKLSSNLRGELYRKLIEEYFSIDNARPGILKSWLLGRGP